MSENCCCTNTEEKKTIRDDEYKRKLMNRLKKIEGQVRGLQKMIENDTYCNDILIQTHATSAALNSFARQLLASHIHGCVINEIKDGKEDIADELISTIQAFMK